MARFEILDTTEVRLRADMGLSQNLLERRLSLISSREHSLDKSLGFLFSKYSSRLNSTFSYLLCNKEALVPNKSKSKSLFLGLGILSLSSLLFIKDFSLSLNSLYLRDLYFKSLFYLLLLTKFWYLRVLTGLPLFTLSFIYYIENFGVLQAFS